MAMGWANFVNNTGAQLGHQFDSQTQFGDIAASTRSAQARIDDNPILANAIMTGQHAIDAVRASDPEHRAAIIAEQKTNIDAAIHDLTAWHSGGIAATGDARFRPGDPFSHELEDQKKAAAELEADKKKLDTQAVAGWKAVLDFFTGNAVPGALQTLITNMQGNLVGNG